MMMHGLTNPKCLIFVRDTLLFCEVEAVYPSDHEDPELISGNGENVAVFPLSALLPLSPVSTVQFINAPRSSSYQ